VVNPVDHRRRSIRLRGWDYTEPGAYFVTIVTHGRQMLFGEIVDGVVLLSMYGRIAAEEWLRTPEVRAYVGIDEFVVMPDHVHGLLWITGHAWNAAQPRGQGATTPRGGQRVTIAQGSLGAVVGGYKSIVARRINDSRGTPGAPVWQRNYYERIVRNQRELAAIRRYIQQNPSAWCPGCDNLMWP
jgi:REP element-mobilizing transposase RayT